MKPIAKDNSKFLIEIFVLKTSNFVKFTFSMFFHEERLILNKNIHNHFMYLHTFLKGKDRFYKKTIRVFFIKMRLKIDEGLDF